MESAQQTSWNAQHTARSHEQHAAWTCSATTDQTRALTLTRECTRSIASPRRVPVSPRSRGAPLGFGASRRSNGGNGGRKGNVKATCSGSGAQHICTPAAFREASTGGAEYLTSRQFLALAPPLRTSVHPPNPPP
jgi:hypothetical protein